MKILHTNKLESGLIFHSKYKESFKEIIYIQEEYNEFKKRCFIKININDYRIKEGIFIRNNLMDNLSLGRNFYAYGLLINLYKTKFIPLDFDDVLSEKKLIELAIYYLNNIEEIQEIDIYQSSALQYKNNYHMHIGLKNYSNVSNFLSKNNDICDGYKLIGLTTSELVIRISQKFFRSSESLGINFITGLKKENNNIIVSNNYVFPLLDNDVSIIKNISKKKLNKIKLRD